MKKDGQLYEFCTATGQGFALLRDCVTREAMKPDFSPAYFPAIICAEFDSPIDALLSLCVPGDEAMNLVTASWVSGVTDCVMTVISGGRPVAVLRTAQGRWAACNAFPEQACASPTEADRRLGKLLRKGKKGMLGCFNPALSAALSPEAGQGARLPEECSIFTQQ